MAIMSKLFGGIIAHKTTKFSRASVNGKWLQKQQFARRPAALLKRDSNTGVSL